MENSDFAETIQSTNRDMINRDQRGYRPLSGQVDRSLNWSHIRTQIGRRYHDCLIDTFKTTCTAQERVCDALRGYGDNIEESIGHGVGIVLYGPPGTGKDHLMVGMLFRACQYEFSVEWVNGMDLFGEMRDAMDSNVSEREILAKYTRPDILAISDPIPPSGDLSQFQAAFLFRLIDSRYRNLKPTWVTVNVKTGEELEKRMGSQVVDRFRDGSLTLHCDWTSYRGAKVAKTDEG